MLMENDVIFSDHRTVENLIKPILRTICAAYRMAESFALEL